MGLASGEGPREDRLLKPWHQQPDSATQPSSQALAAGGAGRHSQTAPHWQLPVARPGSQGRKPPAATLRTTSRRPAKKIWVCSLGRNHPMPPQRGWLISRGISRRKKEAWCTARLQHGHSQRKEDPSEKGTWRSLARARALLFAIAQPMRSCLSGNSCQIRAPARGQTICSVAPEIARVEAEQQAVEAPPGSPEPLPVRPLPQLPESQRATPPRPMNPT